MLHDMQVTRRSPFGESYVAVARFARHFTRGTAGKTDWLLALVPIDEEGSAKPTS